jgi:predicted acylesterase/phospholipase RssA
MYSRWRWLKALAPTLLILVSFTTWGAPSRQEALPPAYANEATVNGLSGVRYAINQTSGVALFLRDLEQTLRMMNRDQPGAPITYLSISGGGGRGAFGAGLLNGWTRHGTRPEFNMVTGISTGALMAPFAFLGPAYDSVLKRLYTGVTDKDLVRERSYAAIFFSDGLGDTSPLYNLISEYVTPELLRKVAHEYTVRHRWLLIGTNNLDTGQPIIWNMGKIAASDTPEALELFRRVMLASASLPGFFSPVMMDVRYQGKAYQEMHVDGGVSRQVFLYPASLFHESGAYKLLEGRKREAYLIRNDVLDDTSYQTVERKTLSIANQALRQFAQSHEDGDTLMAYITAQKDGFGFNMAYVSDDLGVKPNQKGKQRFDQAYMRALFNYAEERAVRGYPWSKTPPGLSEALSGSLGKLRETLNNGNH